NRKAESNRMIFFKVPVDLCLKVFHSCNGPARLQYGKLSRNYNLNEASFSGQLTNSKPYYCGRGRWITHGKENITVPESTFRPSWSTRSDPSLISFLRGELWGQG